MVGIVKPMEGSIMYLQLKDKEFLYLEGLQWTWLSGLFEKGLIYHLSHVSSFLEHNRPWSRSCLCFGPCLFNFHSNWARLSIWHLSKPGTVCKVCFSTSRFPACPVAWVLQWISFSLQTSAPGIIWSLPSLGSFLPCSCRNEHESTTSEKESTKTAEFPLCEKKSIGFFKAGLTEESLNVLLQAQSSSLGSSREEPVAHLPGSSCVSPGHVWAGCERARASSSALCILPAAPALQPAGLSICHKR